MSGKGGYGGVRIEPSASGCRSQEGAEKNIRRLHRCWGWDDRDTSSCGGQISGGEAVRWRRWGACHLRCVAAAATWAQGAPSSNRLSRARRPSTRTCEPPHRPLHLRAAARTLQRLTPPPTLSSQTPPSSAPGRPPRAAPRRTTCWFDLSPPPAPRPTARDSFGIDTHWEPPALHLAARAGED